MPPRRRGGRTHPGPTRVTRSRAARDTTGALAPVAGLVTPVRTRRARDQTAIGAGVDEEPRADHDHSEHSTTSIGQASKNVGTSQANETGSMGPRFKTGLPTTPPEQEGQAVQGEAATSASSSSQNRQPSCPPRGPALSTDNTHVTDSAAISKAGTHDCQKGSPASEGGKRRRSTDDTNANANAVKKVKSTDEAHSGGIDDSAGTPNDNPCEEFATLLQLLKAERDQAERAGRLKELEEPARLGVQLEDMTVARAIASITEAISENSSHIQFSLLDLDTIHSIRAESSIATPVARPGHDVFIPWIPGPNPGDTLAHASLFMVQHAALGSHIVTHFDSADSDIYHRANRDHHATHISTALQLAHWHPNGHLGQSFGTSDGNSHIRQRGRWECGLHVVMYAWAKALGLELTGPHRNNEDFVKQGVDMINLALHGFMNSLTIFAFLRCYRFVDHSAELKAERSFDHTTALPRFMDYWHRHGQLRMDAKLDQMRRIPGNEHVPSVQEYLDLNLQDGLDLRAADVNDFLQRVSFIRSAGATGTLPTQSSDLPNRVLEPDQAGSQGNISPRTSELIAHLAGGGSPTTIAAQQQMLAEDSQQRQHTNTIRGSAGAVNTAITPARTRGSANGTNEPGQTTGGDTSATGDAAAPTAITRDLSTPGAGSLPDQRTASEDHAGPTLAGSGSHASDSEQQRRLTNTRDTASAGDREQILHLDRNDEDGQQHDVTTAAQDGGSHLWGQPEGVLATLAHDIRDRFSDVPGIDGVSDVDGAPPTDPPVLSSSHTPDRSETAEDLSPLTFIQREVQRMQRENGRDTDLAGDITTTIVESSQRPDVLDQEEQENGPYDVNPLTQASDSEAARLNNELFGDEDVFDPDDGNQPQYAVAPPPASFVSTRPGLALPPATPRDRQSLPSAGPQSVAPPMLPGLRTLANSGQHQHGGNVRSTASAGVQQDHAQTQEENNEEDDELQYELERQLHEQDDDGPGVVRAPSEGL